jgi:hypothetical protein
MEQREYYVPKRTGTLTDALLAYGLAIVLQQLFRADRAARRKTSVSLEDRGSHYAILLPGPVQQGWLTERILPLDMARAIKRKKDLPEGVPLVDYNATWDEIRAQKAQREAQRAARTRRDQQAVQELAESFQLQPYRDVTLLLGDYRLQVEGIHNQAVIQWVETVQAGYQAANLQAILQMFATPWADQDAAETAWTEAVKLKPIKRRLTSSQVYNPTMGKGQSRSRADRLLMDNLASFWLLEYLKAVGVFVAAAPRAFPDEKMRKTYVLAPHRIALDYHQEIFTRYFEPAFYGLGASPVKADIFASLQYASAYLSFCLQARSQGETELDLNPRASVTGFYVASYRLLSKNSYTMLNLSFLGLPPWLHRIETLQDVVAVQEVIKEQTRLIRPLEEHFQEGSDLLSAYRDFLTGSQMDAFFDFCAGYGEYVVHTLLAQSRVGQMSVKSLDEILRRTTMIETGIRIEQDDLTEFTFVSGAHPGFHRIAYAIRQSTVIPQRQSANFKSKQRTEKPLYTVRYGLGHTLRRKANTAAELLEALTEFVHEYNAETDQIYENTSQERMADLQNYARTHYRQRILLSDLDDVLLLVKTYGPRLVCNTLVAYGYAAVGAGGKDPDGAKGDEEQDQTSGTPDTDREEMPS